MLRTASPLEPDRPGGKAGPAEAYAGGRTARTPETFPLWGVELRRFPHFIRAFGMVKLAAARANFESRRLSAEVWRGIEGACQELMEGKLHHQLRTDVFQGGAGTATSASANEVIADRALELMGHARGEYGYCHPEHHVNCSQSAAATYRTALHLGTALGNLELVAEVTRLVSALRAKGDELGPELAALAETLAEGARALVAIQDVLEVGPGGTMEAGLGSPRDFPESFARHLARIAGFPVHPAAGRRSAAGESQVFVLHSSGLKSLAIRLSKVGHDLFRLRAQRQSGPGPTEQRPEERGSESRWGAAEVIPEVLHMVCFRVMGGDLTVSLAAEAGQRHGETFGPVIAACIFEAQTALVNAAATLRVLGVEDMLAPGGTLAGTGLPATGEAGDAAGDLAMEMMKTGRGIVELLRQKRVLTEQLMAQTHEARPTTGRKRSPRGGGRG